MNFKSAHFSAFLLLVVLAAMALGLAPSRAVAQPSSPSVPTALPLPVAPRAPARTVPLAFLPPGAEADDRGPSAAIFPPQSLPLRFDHAFHVNEQKLTCQSCHPGGKSSASSRDRLLPSPITCDGCHGTSHADLNAVRAGADPAGACGFCHEGWTNGDGNKVRRVTIPEPNLTFDHRIHAQRNIACQQCHGDVENVGLATRDQLPRMRGCITCHQHPDAAARGAAKAACDTCHLKGGSDGGRIRTSFASGTMLPPRWMQGAAHTPDFIERHKAVAGADSQFCANCHKEDFCVACHDGRVRPRSIHPNDYLNMHAVEARLGTQRCTSCHREQSFCLTCHQRLGVSMSGPSGARDSGRFHPPKSVWSDPPRRPGHHGFEAMRNLNACVSCHIERDCVVCHGGQGIGARFNPHPGGFSSSCATQMRRNPRPCYVCHEPGASVLARCQ